MRLVRVEMARSMGLRVRDQALQEAEMLVRTLNQYDLEVGFDCDNDGEPDTVEIYEKVAKTSCCRLVAVPSRPVGVSSDVPALVSKKKPRKRGGSRRRS